MKPVANVLMVCMGNICRSPTAEAVLRDQLHKAGMGQQVAVASAGTHNYHPGKSADARSAAHAQRRGIDLSGHSARQLTGEDFEQMDLILVMDWDNLALTQAACPPQHQHKVRRLMEFARQHPDTVVPDPYYGGEAGFEHVLDLLDDACAGLVSHLKRSVSN
jgi:protein-tyrosine phosphatase